MLALINHYFHSLSLSLAPRSLQDKSCLSPKLKKNKTLKGSDGGKLLKNYILF